jgi:hypothetical protein
VYPETVADGRLIEPFRAAELKKAANVEFAGTFLPQHTALEMARPQNLSFSWHGLNWLKIT